ncbi:FKBP-type peptidyl-prolyl cis-trans isomerase [Glaciecola sp. SC05]|uniref:FKBP-type peptidyl-prolyl cis-trans isomerase n=1 Tax=Glaciecola sp. SC05 TaxID=1987355 RepID=UPI003527E97D
MNYIILVIGIGLVLFLFYRNANMKKQALENKGVGDTFLAQNKLQDGVCETDSGLQYKVMLKGHGTKHPVSSSTVKVHYHGTLLDGSVFDSTIAREQAISFPLNQVIKGWTEGLQLMVVGDKFKFFIPAHLGYGNRAAGKISAGSVLIFEVELLDIQ